MCREVGDEYGTDEEKEEDGEEEDGDIREDTCGVFNNECFYVNVCIPIVVSRPLNVEREKVVAGTISERRSMRAMRKYTMPSAMRKRRFLSISSDHSPLKKLDTLTCLHYGGKAEQGRR
jgi:hypothetical protein